jgi:hypothetical protein
VKLPRPEGRGFGESLRGTAYRDSLEKQPEPPKDSAIAEIATMAEQYKLTSTGEFSFAEGPLNPGLKSPGTSGFLVVALQYTPLQPTWHGVQVFRIVHLGGVEAM